MKNKKHVKATYYNQLLRAVIKIIGRGKGQNVTLAGKTSRDIARDRANK